MDEPTNQSDYRILTDLDAPKGAHLMGPHEEGSLNIVTLMLTGRATPYLHNGVVYVGDEDHYVLLIENTFFVELNRKMFFNVRPYRNLEYLRVLQLDF